MGSSERISCHCGRSSLQLPRLSSRHGLPFWLVPPLSYLRLFIPVGPANHCGWSRHLLLTTLPLLTTTTPSVPAASSPARTAQALFETSTTADEIHNREVPFPPAVGYHPIPSHVFDRYPMGLELQHASNEDLSGLCRNGTGLRESYMPQALQISNTWGSWYSRADKAKE